MPGCLSVNSPLRENVALRTNIMDGPFKHGVHRVNFWILTVVKVAIYLLCFE